MPCVWENNGLGERPSIHHSLLTRCSSPLLISALIKLKIKCLRAGEKKSAREALCDNFPPASH